MEKAKPDNNGFSLSALYNYVRGRQLEGTYSSDPSVGIWPITSLRVSYGWGAVPEYVWPYASSRDWPPTEPSGLDVTAKQRRILSYQRLRSMEECKLALQKQTFFASFGITSQWFDAKDGIIEVSPPNPKIIGSHCVGVVGYDDERGQFIIRNSWGENWGDKGYGWVPYQYFEAHLQEAWLLDPKGRIWTGLTTPSGIQGLKFCVKGGIGNEIHIIEFYDFSNDERVGWCFGSLRGEFIDVEEIFVRPAFRSQGYGRRLCQKLLELSSQLELPLRLWIPHADVAPNNMPAVHRLVSYLGMQLANSGVVWASYKAEPGAQPFNEGSQSRLVSRPRAFWLVNTK
jgi:GNAT superfamily N-acetyltransferase